jgi:ribosomal protein L22
MEKQFIATQKYLIMSPRKIRLVTDLIRKMKPTDAVLKLPFVQKRAADYVSKVIKNAMASAKNAGVSETDLIFKEIQVKGQHNADRSLSWTLGTNSKEMAHIRIVLTIKSQNKCQISNKI